MKNLDTKERGKRRGGGGERGGGEREGESGKVEWVEWKGEEMGEEKEKTHSISFSTFKQDSIMHFFRET